MPPQLIVSEDGAVRVDSFFKPTPKQNLLLGSDRPYRLGIGGGGSGKSFELIGEAINVACAFAGSSSLLIRRDFPELEKGLILDFRNTVPQELYTWNDTKHVATWLNGAKTFFGHLQSGSEKDLSQYLSDAFVFVGIDELGQFSYEAWAYLSWRNRVNKGCEPNRFGKMPFCRMAGATNPLGPGFGWIRKMWIEHKPVTQMGETRFIEGQNRYYQAVTGKTLEMLQSDPRTKAKLIALDGEMWNCVYDPNDYVYVHSTVIDNPFQMEKDPQYIEKLQKLPPELRESALTGNLDSRAGAYFSNFTHERNVRSLPRDNQEIKFEHWQPRWLSFDWGLKHFSAIHWHAKAMVKDRLDASWKMRTITYRELLINNASYAEVADAIAQDTPEDERALIKYCFLSPDRFRRSENDPSHLISDEISRRMKSHGLPGCSRAYDRREDGATFMYNQIEAGDWIILDNCSAAIASIETRIRDPKKAEDVLKSEDELDDVYDDLRYGIVSMLKEKGKPEDVKLQEKLATLPDHTERMIYAYKHRLDEVKREQPIVRRIVPRWMVKR